MGTPTSKSSTALTIFLHKSVFYVLIVAAACAIASAASTSNEHQELHRSKRSNWNKATGLWGKRSGYYPNFRDLAVYKRPENQWGKLNSLWGKRSTWDSATGLWGKRSGDEMGVYDYIK